MKSDDAQAEEQLRTSLGIAREQDARSFELRAATALAKQLIAAGRPTEAREVLAPAYGWFTEGLDTGDLVAARALLSKVG
jgi:predicted ATPase